MRRERPEQHQDRERQGLILSPVFTKVWSMLFYQLLPDRVTE